MSMVFWAKTRPESGVQPFGQRMRVSGRILLEDILYYARERNRCLEWNAIANGCNYSCGAVEGRAVAPIVFESRDDLVENGGRVH